MAIFGKYNFDEVEVNNKLKNDAFNIKENDILKLKKAVFKLNHMFLKSDDKVAYYYEDLESNLTLSFNQNMTFYAASTIKMLVSLYLYEQASLDRINLEEKLLFTEEYRRDGTGVMKNGPINECFTLKELIKYTICESDNSAYKMLMDYVGIDTIKAYGNTIGATTTMIGKDHYGTISPYDAKLYWHKLLNFTKQNNIPGKELLDYFLNTSVCLIDKNNISNNPFAHKYGHWDIAYHECGIVYGEHPYFICIMTQKGNKKDKIKFINATIKKINTIHEKINTYKTN